MKMRAVGFVGMAALLLCGCTDADWNHLLSFGPPEQTNEQTAEQSGDASQVASAELPPPATDQAPAAAGQPTEAAPPVAAPQPSYSVTQTITTETPVARVDSGTGYCQKMAQSTGADATRDGMDGPEQQRVADATYRQCLRFYGSSGR